MAKHIDVEMLKSAMLENINIMAKVLGEKNADSYVSVNHVIDLIDGLPAADVQEVKHGRWKRCFVKDAFQGAFHCVNVCSECGRESLAKENFCPHCGARMDEKDGDKNA